MRCTKAVSIRRLASRLAVLLLLLAPADSFADTKVLEAVYGTDGGWKDVSGLLESLAAGGTKEVTIGNHTMGGDPAPGKVKALRLVLRDATGVHEVEIKEGESLRFPISASRSAGEQIAATSGSHDKQQPDEKAESASAQAKNDDAGGDLAPEVLKAIVTISQGGSGGTGFICTINGKNYLVTNQHVIAPLRAPRFQTYAGDLVTPGALQIATDADLAVMALASLPPGVKPLELLDAMETEATSGDAVTIPGNSKADGVITQTHGKLLAIGGQRIEIDCPVYGGNSGSPIIHRKTGKVIGVLTEAEFVQFDPFTEASFRNKKSALKSEIRYFGHRLDTVSSWRPSSFGAMNAESFAVEQSKQELRWLEIFYTGSSDAYKRFADLHAVRNEAEAALGRRDLALSEQARARERFIWKLENLIQRAVKRLPPRPLAYCHGNDIGIIRETAEFLESGLGVVRRDDDLTLELIQRGF
jgi:hypothetical protein